MLNFTELAQKIDILFERTQTATLTALNQEDHQLIDQALQALNQGKVRVAEKRGDDWVTHEWIKKAILLFFRRQQNRVIPGAYTQYYDKVPLKFADWTPEDFAQAGIRIVPPATVRYGAYIASNTVLMPSYVNLGAFIDSGTMVDTWATVGSCAQIGKNVHLSGGVGIGGVLEPLQAKPTIIEDDCFIGARSEVVEGVIVEAGAVLAMGVFISQSTPIYNRTTQEISFGRVPAGSVVVPGSLPAKDGSHQLAAAIIVKNVDQKTKQKVGINHLLREASIEKY